MPGVQNKYAIDVNNRFNCEEDDDQDGSDGENVDPFEQLKQLNKAAEQAKLAPKPKKTIQKKKPVEKKVETEKKIENKREDKPRRQAPRRDYQDRRQNDDGGAVDERPKREFRPRGDRGFGGGDGGSRGGGAPRRNFDRRSRDPRSSAKGYDKKDGSGTGNWGNVDDELAGQTEKVETEIKEENAADDSEKQTTEEKAPREPEEVTMTLEEYRAQKKSVNRNPNAKAVEDDTAKETKKDYGDAKRKGRAGRMAPVDFRPAPLVAPRGGGDRRGGNRYNNNRGDYKQNKPAAAEGYNLENDFPSL